MEFLLYIVSIGCIIFITFRIGKFFNHLSDYMKNNSNLRNSSSSNSIISDNNITQAEEMSFLDINNDKKTILNPVMSSEPDRDRKIHFNDSDFLVPEHLTEDEKQLLEQFYGKS
jgi:hypothetical protein